jgi:hypothetical protein
LIVCERGRLPRDATRRDYADYYARRGHQTAEERFMKKRKSNEKATQERRVIFDEDNPEWTEEDFNRRDHGGRWPPRP